MWYNGYGLVMVSTFLLLLCPFINLKRWKGISKISRNRNEEEKPGLIYSLSMWIYSYLDMERTLLARKKNPEEHKKCWATICESIKKNLNTVNKLCSSCEWNCALKRSLGLRAFCHSAHTLCSIVAMRFKPLTNRYNPIYWNRTKCVNSRDPHNI